MKENKDINEQELRELNKEIKETIRKEKMEKDAKSKK